MKKIGVLLENMFDEQELIYPYYKLQELYQVDLLGTEKNTLYKGKSGLEIKSDLSTREVKAEDYDGLVIPGGFSPDYMRRSSHTINLVRDLDSKKKPIAAICHGPWVIVSACKVEGLNMTSYPSIKDDLINAGANYLDREVVIDENIITSRSPKDLVFFMKAFIEMVEQN